MQRFLHSPSFERNNSEVPLHDFHVSWKKSWNVFICWLLLVLPSSAGLNPLSNDGLSFQTNWQYCSLFIIVELHLQMSTDRQTQMVVNGNFGFCRINLETFSSFPKGHEPLEGSKYITVSGIFRISAGSTPKHKEVLSDMQSRQMFVVCIAPQGAWTSWSIRLYCLLLLTRSTLIFWEDMSPSYSRLVGRNWKVIKCVLKALFIWCKRY